MLWVKGGNVTIEAEDVSVVTSRIVVEYNREFFALCRAIDEAIEIPVSLTLAFEPHFLKFRLQNKPLLTNVENFV